MNNHTQYVRHNAPICLLCRVRAHTTSLLALRWVRGYIQVATEKVKQRGIYGRNNTRNGDRLQDGKGLGPEDIPTEYPT
jgi:hypothetical protein